MSRIIKSWCETNLIFRIVFALVVGSLLGVLLPYLGWISHLGDVFVGSMKAIAPILVFSVVCSSVAQANENIGKRFKTVLLLYLASTVFAAVIAVLGCNMFPLKIDLSAKLSATIAQETPSNLSEVLLHFLKNIVQNPIVSMSSGNYLGILFWAVVIGFSIKQVAHESTIRMLSDISGAVSKIVKGIIQLAPIGILGLVYRAVCESGIEVFSNYGKLLFLLIGCMLASVFVANPLIVGLVLRKNPFPLIFRCLKESGIPAFFTRSSAANIPVNMQLCSKLGIDKDFYSVSIPLGSSINVTGATVTIIVMALTVCHSVGIKVDLFSSFLLGLLASVSAPGTPGVTGGSLLLIPMACSLFGVGNDVAMQAVGVGFVIGVVQDSLETALNSSGDVVFTATAEYYGRKKRGENLDFLKKI